ncbi:MAG: GNAT family N-acetyltransferase [Dehalococcoidia bacterium]
MATVEIRPVRADDAEAIDAIRRQASVLRFTQGLPSERLAERRGAVEAFGADEHVFVAVIDGRVAGVAGLHVQHDRRRHVGLVGISVHERHQNSGVGRALMQTLLELADRYLILVRIELEVMANNERGIHLYESLGFVEEGRKRKDVIQDGEYVDMVVMGRVR